MSEGIIEPIVEEIESIVGSENVSLSKIIRLSYSEDASPFHARIPGLIVRPAETLEVSQILRLANEYLVPVVPAGGRSGICGACLPRVPNAIVLDLTRMDNIVEVDEDSQTVTVQAGLRWAELIYKLSKLGYKVGFRGPFGGNAGTVGGSLSSNSVGCGSAKWGSSGDSVVSLEVVLPTGEILRTGSGWNPLAKKFARYATFNDLTGLFIGDHGILGVKTEATLKIYPLPEGRVFGDFGFNSVEAASKAMYEIQKRKLAEELVLMADRHTVSSYAPQLAEKYSEVESVLAVIIEEASEEIAEAKKKLVERIVRECGGFFIGTFFSRLHWGEMFNVVQPLFEEGYWYNTCHLRPITMFPELVRKAHEIFRKYGVDKDPEITWVASALGIDRCHCTGWITLFLKNPEKKRILEKTWSDLRKVIIETGGVPYWAGLLWEEYVLPRVHYGFFDLLKKIKRTLDPNNILHPLVFGL